MKLVALKPGLNFESSIPSGDARSDARSDAPTSLTLRYRYRFANSSHSWGKPPTALLLKETLRERASYGRR
ncbi:hypothetical protein [Nostoc sp.]|uniref:hypothetical protein n=1 Tax=Nostoc sp. TaxID=1180 RepID=UPI002FFBAFFF